MDVVQRQRDAGVAVLGQQLERVLEPVVGQPVGDIAVQLRLTSTLPSALRQPCAASGHSAATPAAGTSDAGAGEQAGLQRDQAQDARADGALHAAPATGRCDGVGVRAADDRGVRADEAERGGARQRGARRLSSAPAAATPTVRGERALGHARRRRR